MVYCMEKTAYNSSMRGTTENIRQELGQCIRDLRKTAGSTQEELGEKAELSYKFIGEIERGQVNVSLDSIIRIAEALGVKIGDLFSKERIPILKLLLQHSHCVITLYNILLYEFHHKEPQTPLTVFHHGLLNTSAKLSYMLQQTSEVLFL